MIEIKITQKPEKLENIGLIDKTYELNTSIKINEDSNITQCFMAFLTAMKIEGYVFTDKTLVEAIEAQEYDIVEHDKSYNPISY